MFRNARFAVGAAALMAACGGGDRETFTMRDSAGVQIVENQDVGWSTGTQWTVDTVPLVDIGSRHGDSGSALFQVWDALRMRDGRIAIANAGSAQVKLYDSAGRHLATIGRRGQGPGEFLFPWWLGELPGDSLLVLDDPRRFRISVFTRDAAYARGITPTPPGGAAETDVIGQFPDGSMLARRERRELPAPGSGDIWRTQAALVRLGPDGAQLDSAGRFPSRTMRMSGIHMWGPQGHAAVAESTFYFGSGERFEIEERARNGRLLRVIRLARANRAVTEVDRQRWLAEARASEELRLKVGSEKIFEGATFASHFPPYASLLTDPRGSLWVQEFAAEGEARRWSVFDRRGVFLGDVTMPERFRVFELGDEDAMGLWRNADGVERIRVYRILRPDAH